MPLKSTPPPDLQPEPLSEGPLELKQVTDLMALQLVRETFDQYESFRTQSHDPRWRTADRLYQGKLPVKTWEGTTIPRANVGVPITFDQIETALSNIDNAIFGVDREWFQVESEKAVPPQAARAVKDALLYYMERTNIRSETSLSLQSLLQYGNGGLEIYWDESVNGFKVKWVDIRDFYFDPNCPSPDIEEGRSLLRRKLMTVEELDEYRDVEGMDIPGRDTLVFMSQNRKFAEGDNSKTGVEVLRGVNYNEMTDYNPFPAAKLIEVLIYYDHKRIIWVLNRDHVAYNEPNPYGFYPFVFGPCSIVVGRFYAMSFCDILEGKQRYIEALYNNHLDEVALSLNPPRISQLGGNINSGLERWRPGLHAQVANPKDVAVIAPTGVTTNVFTDIQYLETAAEKHTGVNSLGMGVARPGNINRTVGGVQQVSQGSMMRMQKIMGNIERYMLVPLLEKAYRMMQLHADKMALLEVIGQGAQTLELGPDAFDKPMRFKILAASRYTAREKLAGQFQFITQYLLNGPVMEQLKSMQQTVDFTEWIQLLKDATGTERMYSLIRPMNQQEMQAAQQPPPQVQAAMQKAQQDAQVKLQMGQAKNQTELQKAQIGSQTTLQKTQMEQQNEDERSAREMIKVLLEQEQGKAKENAELRKAQNDIQIKREEHRMNAQGMMQKMMFDRASQAEKIRAQRDMNRVKEETARTEAAINAQVAQQSGQIKVADAVQQMRIKAAQAEQQARYNKPPEERRKKKK